MILIQAQLIEVWYGLSDITKLYLSHLFHKCHIHAYTKYKTHYSHTGAEQYRKLLCIIYVLYPHIKHFPIAYRKVFLSGMKSVSTCTITNWLLKWTYIEKCYLNSVINNTKNSCVMSNFLLQKISLLTYQLIQSLKSTRYFKIILHLQQAMP